jgi:hypothetical protein
MRHDAEEGPRPSEPNCGPKSTGVSFVRTITLEDHFATPMFQEKFPQGNVSGYSLADRRHYLGYDIPAELLSLSDSRLAAMDVSGIDLQVVSLTMPDPRPSGRRHTILDSSSERSHAVCREKKRSEENTSAVLARESGCYDQREFFHSGFPVHAYGARCGKHSLLGRLAIRV